MSQDKVKVYWNKKSNTLYVVPQNPRASVVAVTSKGKSMKTYMVIPSLVKAFPTSYELAVYIGEL